MGRPHLTWMDTTVLAWAASLGHALKVVLASTRLGKPSSDWSRMCGGGGGGVVGGLGLQFCLLPLVGRMLLEVSGLLFHVIVATVISQ